MLAGHRVTWKYSANLAPWWGGWWERMVKTMKELLHKQIGQANLSFEELETTIIEIEGIINSRPLTYVTEGDGEPLPLTPGHLVSGRRVSGPYTDLLPDVTVNTSNLDALLVREAERRAIISRWWRRWGREYLADLRRFHSKGRATRSIRVGEVVHIHEEPPVPTKMTRPTSRKKVVALVPFRPARKR